MAEDEFPIDVTDEEIAATFAPFVQETLPVDDPRWRDLQRTLGREQKKRRLRRAVLGTLFPKLRRRQENIEINYSQQWTNSPFEKLMRTDGAPTPFVWRDKGYLACSHGVARLYILFLARLLTRLKPSSVLEVGAGNGQNLFVLSALFPEISFTGVELTEGGVESARAVLLEPRLPEIVARFAPEPVADLATPANLSIERGNAAQLDFEDGAFDLVYTVLALEQMEEIRDRALSEVSRVAGKYAVLIEPFRDWNDRGIRRDYVYANDYFSARIDDLSSYGLKPLCAWSDFPTKVRLGSGVVVAEKMTGRSES